MLLEDRAKVMSLSAGRKELYEDNAIVVERYINRLQCNRSPVATRPSTSSLGLPPSEIRMMIKRTANLVCKIIGENLDNRKFLLPSSAYHAHYLLHLSKLTAQLPTARSAATRACGLNIPPPDVIDLTEHTVMILTDTDAKFYFLRPHDLYHDYYRSMPSLQARRSVARHQRLRRGGCAA